MDYKTKSLIETLISNIKRETKLTEVEFKGSMIKNTTKAYLGKPKNETIKVKPRSSKHAKYHIRSSNPNKIDFKI